MFPEKWSSLEWAFSCTLCCFLPTGVNPCSADYVVFVSAVNYSIRGICDVCQMRRYSQNMLQWKENDIECVKRPTGDY